VKFVVQLTTNPQQTEVMEFKHTTATLVRPSCETEKTGDKREKTEKTNDEDRETF